MKKEEYEYKVGDWVVKDGVIDQILDCKPRSVVLRNVTDYYHYDNFISYWKLWIPVKDELCVFWNNEMKSFIIARLMEINPEVENKYVTETGIGYSHTEPLESLEELKADRNKVRGGE